MPEIEYLTQTEFDELLEYSISIPTGTTIGKRWKRHIYTFKVKGKEFNAGYIPHDGTFVSDEWWLGEYIEDPIPNQVGIRWREIKIAGELDVDKQIARFLARG